MGTLSYADDITLITFMLDILCNKFAIDICIYNSKKNICIEYGEDVMSLRAGFMNGRLLSCHSEVRHLVIFSIIGCVILEIVIIKFLISLVSSINFIVSLS